MMWLKMGNHSFGTAIDLCDLGLGTIEETDEEFRIGAMVTLRQMETHAGLNAYSCGAIKAAFQDIVGVQFRNGATLGGSLWRRMGFSDIVTAFLAMDSYVELHEGGIVPLPGDYLRGVEALCRKHDILFICDEVQAGLCRTGTFWAFQQHGLTPDAISMAKSLANGLPMGAMLATDEMAKGFEAGSHATTFGGGALASGVAAKCVEIMLRDKLADRAAELGKHVMDRVRAIQDKLPGTVREVRGLGLMIGIELAVDAAAVWRELIARGFICNLSHGVTLRLLPALTIDKADLDAFIDTLEDILRTAK